MVPDRTVAETLILKQRFYQSLVTHNIPHPQTISITADTSSAHGMPLTYPVFVKPSLSQAFSQRFRRKGFLAHNSTELQYYLTQAQHNHLDVMVQEIIPGPTEHGYIFQGYLTRHSQLRFLFVSQKLRQPRMFSIESAQVSIPLSAVAACSRQIVEYLTHLRYRGLFEAEVKLDAGDHTFKLLEVNARSGGSNSHPDACGANHVLLSYLEAIGEDVPQIPSYQAGIYSTYCFYDLVSLYTLCKRGELVLTPVLRSYLRTRDWIFARDDLRPFLAELLSVIKRAGTMIRRARMYT
jgi:D-aspartate ligase